MKKLFTLSMVYDDKRILLGMKKIGFGQGWFNGFGGKVESGELIGQAARRELQEESGLEAANLEKRAVLTFKFYDKSEELEVHVFAVTDWQGQPQETEEMKPRWFLLDEIPYTKMWVNDKYWLPLFLQGKRLEAKFYLQEKNKLLKYKIREV